MYFFRSIFTLIIILALAISCKKKEKEVEPIENPENMVPFRYKGIPEPIKIPDALDDPNNWTESTFISRSGREPVVKTNVLTYQTNGLPATSTIKEVAGPYQMTQTTKYNYENCN